MALVLAKALTTRPAGLSSGIDQDCADYTVFCGEWNIGRIYEVRGGPEHLRWFWAWHFPGKRENPRKDNRVATLEAAKTMTVFTRLSRVPDSSRFGALSRYWRRD